jgi:myosin heavy subunit
MIVLIVILLSIIEYCISSNHFSTQQCMLMIHGVTIDCQIALINYEMAIDLTRKQQHSIDQSIVDDKWRIVESVCDPQIDKNMRRHIHNSQSILEMRLASQKESITVNNPALTTVQQFNVDCRVLLFRRLLSEELLFEQLKSNQITQTSLDQILSEFDKQVDTECSQYSKQFSQFQTLIANVRNEKGVETAPASGFLRKYITNFDQKPIVNIEKFTLETIASISEQHKNEIEKLVHEKETQVIEECNHEKTKLVNDLNQKQLLIDSYKLELDTLRESFGQQQSDLKQQIVLLKNENQELQNRINSVTKQETEKQQQKQQEHSINNSIQKIQQECKDQINQIEQRLASEIRDKTKQLLSAESELKHLKEKCNTLEQTQTKQSDTSSNNKKEVEQIQTQINREMKTIRTKIQQIEENENTRQKQETQRMQNEIERQNAEMQRQVHSISTGSVTPAYTQPISKSIIQQTTNKPVVPTKTKQQVIDERMAYISDLFETKVIKVLYTLSFISGIISCFVVINNRKLRTQMQRSIVQMIYSTRDSIKEYPPTTLIKQLLTFVTKLFSGLDIFSILFFAFIGFLIYSIPFITIGKVIAAIGNILSFTCIFGIAGRRTQFAAVNISQAE